VVVDSPGVDQNLHGHPAAIMTFAATHAPAEWSGFVGAGAFLQVTSDRDSPDLQLIYYPDRAHNASMFTSSPRPRTAAVR
jgi:hypothetical protein